MKFSVVTISFNQAEFLERTIQSVLAQREDGVELDYVIVDPGSTDGSRDIIEKYRPEFSHVLLDKDKGAADGLNKGLEKATGEVFYYLNSDDMVAPGTFKKVADFLGAHPQVDAVFANGRFIDTDDRTIRRIFSHKFVSPLLHFLDLTTLIQQSTFVRMTAVGDIRFNIDNRTCWDGEFFNDIAARGARFQRVWDDWGLFRLHQGSITGSGRLMIQYDADMERIRRTFSTMPSAVRKALRFIAMPVARALDPRYVVNRVQTHVANGK